VEKQKKGKVPGLGGGKEGEAETHIQNEGGEKGK